MNICIDGAINLVQAVLKSYSDLINGDLIFKENQLRSFNYPKFKFPPIKISHHRMPTEERRTIRLEYKNAKENALIKWSEEKEQAQLKWDLQRRNWLEQQMIWTLKDGFWFKCYGELFGYDEEKLKNGFVKMIKEKLLT